MNINDIVGVVGVSMLLLAYFLSLFKFIGNNSLAYILLNVLGAAISCVASFLISYFPFVVLEAVWALVSVAALIKYIATQNEA